MNKKKLMKKDEIRNFIKENNIKYVEGIEDRIISMYANGMSFSDIGNQIEDIYGAELSSETLSRITDNDVPPKLIQSKVKIMYL